MDNAVKLTTKLNIATQRTRLCTKVYRELLILQASPHEPEPWICWLQNGLHPLYGFIHRPVLFGRRLVFLLWVELWVRIYIFHYSQCVQEINRLSGGEAGIRRCKFYLYIQWVTSFLKYIYVELYVRFMYNFTPDISETSLPNWHDNRSIW